MTSGHSPQAEFARLLKKDGLKARAFKAHFVSDHIPVGLSFTLNAPSKKRDFKIPHINNHNNTLTTLTPHLLQAADVGKVMTAHRRTIAASPLPQSKHTTTTKPMIH